MRFGSRARRTGRGARDQEARGREMRGRRAGVSALGVVVLGAALVLGLAGWWLGWQELTIPAAVLGGILLAAAGFAVGTSSYAATIDLPEQRVTVGDAAYADVLITNRSRWRSLPARVEIPLGSALAEFALPSLAAGRTCDEIVALPTARRAVLQVGPLRTVRGDPLGLLSRSARIAPAATLYVHPALVPLGGVSAGVLRDLEGAVTPALSDADVSFHALRPYEVGDDRRHIHWKSSAHTGSLMVRQFEDTRRTHTAIGIDTGLASYRDDDSFELAVSVAASIAVQAVREGRDVDVVRDAALLRWGTSAALLDALSAIQPRRILESGIAVDLARLVPQASLAILVTGSLGSVADWHRATRHFAASVTVVVLHCEVGAGVRAQGAPASGVGTARSSAHAKHASIGALRELPGALARLVG